jgi:D-beta-D-heptose 7-phosphate kinase/D-beta-D-heptose 1-phosphate adenosyltransferase
MNIPQQKQFKILVIGDSCEDIYHYGVCERISPEAPVPIFIEEEIINIPGMSSNVVENLSSFGVEVFHITNNKIKISKHRFVEKKFKQHLLRVDKEEETKERIDLSLIKKYQDLDAVIISDYNKGFLLKEDCEMLCKFYAKKQIPIFVDSKKNDLSCFTNSFIKINEKEFENIKSFSSDSKILVTLGERGVLFENIIYETDKVEVFDVCGAGDVFLASFVYYYILTNNIKIAIVNSNKLASFSVTKFGTYKLTKQDINKVITEKNEKKNYKYSKI